MKTISKKQQNENFADALCLLLQATPPPKFKLAYFQILLMSGRVEEATEYLNQFKTEYLAELAQASQKAEDQIDEYFENKHAEGSY